VHPQSRGPDAAAPEGRVMPATVGRASSTGPPLADGAGPLLEVSRVEKRYGGIHALRQADLRISRAGAVHCLVGENGSGKSTMLGILSGQVQPDAGRVTLDGRTVSFGSPPEAVRAGIAMVSQETAVARHLTVAENILLGNRLVRRRGRIDWRATRRRAEEVLGRLKLDYDASWMVERLRPDQRQMIEIARALSIDARVLILDEPTSFLTEDEVESLFRAVREVSSHGVATIFVSHRLPELFAIADEVTVLRDGRTVSAGPMDEYDADRLVTDMIGEAHEAKTSTRSRSRAAQDVPRLAVTKLSDGVAMSSVTLDVAPGEIVGVAGLAGSGRTALLETIFGVCSMAAGEVVVDGRRLIGHDPPASIAAGMGFVPAERKTDGLVLTMSVTENLTMAQTSCAAWWRPPRQGPQVDAISWLVGELRVKAASGNSLARTLSGGNQQKVALGKWLMNNPSLLLLEEPTRGVDVRAKGEIHDLLRGLAGRGVGVLVSSSENDELLSLCHRILVMFRGEVVASVLPEETTESKLAQLAGGITQ
jgi:ABC-type sugar transport system ATPase subunit